MGREVAAKRQGAEILLFFGQVSTLDCMKQARNKTTSTPIEKLLLIGSVVLITCLAFEALATTNAMPTVVADLGGDRWYSLAAGMVLAGQILSTTIAGWWADKMGVRRPLVFGLSLIHI